MLNIAHRVLFSLGATHVQNIFELDDPTNEEEFNRIIYTSPLPITWEQYTNALPTVEVKYGLRFLRRERSTRLSATDWIMTVDNIDTLLNKNEWVAYRQALRDLPDNPPKFVWKNAELDFSKMDMPVEPPVIRIPKQS